MIGVAGAGVLALVVTACGTGGSDSGTDSGKGTSEPAAPTALSVETTARNATWTFRSATHQLKVAPKRLARGSAADLADAHLDEDLKGKIPYYLTVTYTNTGSAALSQPAPQANFTVALADGTPGDAVSLWSSNPLATESGSSLPDNCDKTGPGSVAAGATATVCQIVMLPEGHEPATVAYADDASDTHLWKVGDGKGDDDGGRLLAAGTTGSSSYEDVTTKGVAVPIKVTPKSARAGSIADLGDYDLSDEQKKLVPWYVTLAYRNAGKVKLLPAMDTGVGLRTAGGREIQPVPLLDFSGSAEGEGIDQCRGSVPNTRLEPNSALTLCTIHLLPKGDRPAMISFTGEGKGATTLMWRAG
ncbi:hypothetical protein [Streptomyces resistomycificus]|uniref:Uncharacterized protein n=1 Tax=Streptomyces resistomycificus TaxID=67356 RepID=A0A0L8LYD9_9ACTN|nr:hypothetical protein [Streptomyces resistomycificus]KOG43114.1 hypothetical protein ADK37_02600 [Streptomyces resistomycificus]KUN97679.1 hypothetical protein AQJ84_16315 [Streptomyces resistomycificus]